MGRSLKRSAKRRMERNQRSGAPGARVHLRVPRAVGPWPNVSSGLILRMGPGASRRGSATWLELTFPGRSAGNGPRRRQRASPDAVMPWSSPTAWVRARPRAGRYGCRDGSRGRPTPAMDGARMWDPVIRWKLTRRDRSNEGLLRSDPKEARVRAACLYGATSLPLTSRVPVVPVSRTKAEPLVMGWRLPVMVRFGTWSR